METKTETLTRVTLAPHTKVRIAKTTARFGVPSLRYVDGVFEVVGCEMAYGEPVYELVRVGTTGATTKARSHYVFRLEDVGPRAEAAKVAKAHSKVAKAERAAAITDYRAFLKTRPELVRS